MREVDGYTLFDDVKNKDFRANNRAIVMANMMEDNLYEDTGKLTDHGKFILEEYKTKIGDEEFVQVYGLLFTEAKKRGLL